MSIRENIMENGIEINNYGTSILDFAIKTISLIDGKEWWWAEIAGVFIVNYKDSDTENKIYKHLTDAVIDCMKTINEYYASIGM